MNYSITKQTILNCAATRTLQVAELEQAHMEENCPLTSRARRPPLFNPTVAVAQFQNGSKPVVKVLPIALIAKWARLAEQEEIGIVLTERGVRLECGGVAYATAHFYELANNNGDLAAFGPPLRLVAATDTFELESPPDASHLNALRQQAGAARKRLVLARAFAKAKMELKSIRARCRHEAAEVRAARKLIIKVSLQAALAKARRVLAVRRFVGAALKPPFTVPSWATPDDSITIRLALNELRRVTVLRDSYQPQKRFDKWTVRAAKSLGMSPAKYAKWKCQTSGNPEYLRPHEVHGPKWRQLRSAVETAERRVREALKHALRSHLASLGWHRSASYVLVSWDWNWRREMSAYSRARLLLHNWPTASQKLAVTFNEAFHAAKTALKKLKDANGLCNGGDVTHTGKRAPRSA